HNSIIPCLSILLKIDFRGEKQAEVVRYIFATYACGHSLAFIANELKILEIPSPTNKLTWGRQIINNILENDKYLGNQDYPQIVQNDIFINAAKRKHNSAYSMRYHVTYKDLNSI
ncbi:MAG: recombinase family protein, partial [Eubacterium sp.]|nr:recombinase family protein [Eubacterium sp.]